MSCSRKVRQSQFLPVFYMGERIVVNFDTNEPKHSRMEL